MFNPVPHLKYITHDFVKCVCVCIRRLSSNGCSASPILGPDRRKWTDIHPSSQLPDCEDEGRKGGAGALCWRLHHDEPPDFQRDLSDYCPLHGGKDLKKLRSSGINSLFY